MWCTLALQMTNNNPITYTISGSCRSFTTSSATPITLAVSGNSSLTEAPNCKLTGSYLLGADTVTILDARIEGGPSKRQIVGTSRITNSSTDFELFDFSFQR
jgi:hypothetical protein